MDKKFGQLRNERRSEIFSGPGDANGTTINVFDVYLIIR